MASKAVFEQKQQIVEEIKTKVKAAKSMVIVDYKGITVKNDTELRAKMREANVEYKVLKNKLVKIALNQLGYTELDKDLEGTTAISFAMGDLVAPAKIIIEAMGKYNKLSIKSGMVEGKPITAAGVKELAELPPKEVLVARVLGMLLAPISGLARVLSGTVGGLAIALKQIADNK
ncbi:MAG: 50S ribosomal protein L10 [Clostridia bacterium]|nr:50S ribosomal protein L10 [Clostridia bacterium]